MAGSSYNPRHHGAKCDICPLKGQMVVPPEPPESLHALATSFQQPIVAIVGEAPGEQDERQQRPFVGPSGSELEKALRGAQLKRGSCHMTHVLLCRPPEGKLTEFQQVLSRQRKAMEKDWKKACEEAEKNHHPMPPKPDYPEDPVECCKPRFEAEIQRYGHFITLGKTANQAVTGISASILAVRGGLTDLEATERTPARKVMPTIHPSFCLHQPRWFHVFRNDIHKAGRWFRGEAEWEPPQITYHPTPEVLRKFLSQDIIFTFDLETDGIESLTARIRCVGIGDENHVMLIGIRGKDGYTKFYDDPREEAEVIEILKEFFQDESKVKSGHNAGYYDRIVLEQQWGITVKPLIDTILLHKNVESELPHGLAYVGSMYTDAPSWKCYDGQTEILTEKGWQRFDALERNVKVAQWDKGMVSFVQPSAYVDQPYEGKIWHLQNQSTNLFVTPDHKMVYRPKGSDDLKICQVQDLPPTGSIPHTGTKETGDFFVAVPMVQLLVATQADGSWVKTKEGVWLDFGFTKERKIERLTNILDGMNIQYNRTLCGKKSPYTRIRVLPCSETALVFSLLGDEKQFSPRLLDLPLDARRAFLDELPLWDGTKGKEHTNYNSTVEHNADLVQAIAVISGRAARKSFHTNGTHQPVYRVSLPSGSVRSREWSKLDGLDREQIDYTGRIYCVSVPSGFVVVRRDGKVVISSNTDREGNKLSYDAENDRQLHEYCGFDVGITARVLPKLVEQVKLRRQDDVWRMDQKIQAICADMHTVGMMVDQTARLAKEKELLGRRHTLLTDIRDRVGNNEFNPGSVYHVRDLLFGKWKLVAPLEDEERETSSGDPSTSDLVLRALLSDPSVPDDQRSIIKLMRYYRKVQKVLGTYVVKLRPWDMDADLGWDEEDDWVDKETRSKYGEIKRGIVNPKTGRMHPGYNAQVAVTGRLSSSKPINCFDGETEILTEQGWIRFDALPRDVRVAQWDGHKVSFTLPTAYHEGQHQGEMVHFVSQSADLLMTPNHRIPLMKNSGRVVTITAEELVSLGAGHHTIHAAKLHTPEKGIPFSVDEIRLLVALHADASFVQVNGKHYGLDVGFSKDRKIKRFSSLLGRMGDSLQWTESNGRFYLKSTPRLEEILGLIQRQNRVWGKWLLDMNEEQCSAFEEEIWFWDACYERKSQYANKNEVNADWIQTFLALRGVRANKRRYTSSTGSSVWSVDVRRTKTNAITHRAERKRVSWNGMVYCVTVPSDAILVRRNGKITITRQSQNFPKAMRSLVVAAPGHVLVGADMDQLELRIAAARWGVELYLRAFEEGKDPHSMTAFAVFGKAFCDAAGLDPVLFERSGILQGTAYDEKGKFIGDGEAKKMRDLSKAVQYAAQYMATVETVHKLIAKTEVPAKGTDGAVKNDGTTDLPYALLPLRKVRQMRDNWLKGAPEFEKGWEREIQTYRDIGYIAEEITGRRRDFLDGEAPNEIVNFPIQASAAGLMNLAIVKLHEQIPLHKWGPGTGIINQCHDSIVIECPESEGENVARMLEEAMNQVHPALPGVVFSAGADIGKDWKKVG